MKPFFLKKESMWIAVLFAGVVMVAAGVFQLFTEYYGKTEVPLGGAPSVGAPVNKDAARNAPEGKATGDEGKKEVRENRFFVEYRLERDRTRSQQIDLLREIVNNQNSPDETRKEAQRRLLAISQSIDLETRLENLIRAENFKDAVVFIQEKSTTIIVQTPVLTTIDKDRLTEIAVRVTGHQSESVVVIPKV